MNLCRAVAGISLEPPERSLAAMRTEAASTLAGEMGERRRTRSRPRGSDAEPWHEVTNGVEKIALILGQCGERFRLEGSCYYC